MKVIKHANIIYVRKIYPTGGVETYVYELVKKYQDYDVAVVCKEIDPAQKKRLKKFCRVYVHTDETIDCKVAILNADPTIIDFITEKIWKENAGKDEGIYMGIHIDYTYPGMGDLPQDPRIKNYIAITQDILNKFPLFSKSGEAILCRNPLELEEDEPCLILVSPTRLAPEKGGDIMLKLANTLDELNINFLWLILTEDKYHSNVIFQNRKVIHVKNRLDVGNFLKFADWMVIPSSVEGDSYSFKEALYRGVPIVAKHLPYFDEIGIKDGENALFIDDNNIEEVAKKMLKPLKFTFKHVEDSYDKLLYKSESRYKEEMSMRYLVEALPEYEKLNVDDKDLGRVPTAGEQWEIDRERLDILLGDNSYNTAFVKVVEEIKPEATEEKPKKKKK